MKMTKLEFISQAIQKFGEKFDYSLVPEVIDNTTKTIIKIICPIHEEFKVTIRKFLTVNKFGCPKCGRSSRKETTEGFIKKAKQLYGDRFTYEKTNYINSNEKVIVTCLFHGDFNTRPADFLRGHSCPKCKAEVTREFNKQTKRLTKE